jgi:hypothetical protein
VKTGLSLKCQIIMVRLGTKFSPLGWKLSPSLKHRDSPELNEEKKLFESCKFAFSLKLGMESQVKLYLQVVYNIARVKCTFPMLGYCEQQKCT